MKMTNEPGQAMLFANKWPRLVITKLGHLSAKSIAMIFIISTTLMISFEEEMTSFDHFTPYLSEKEWATMVRIKFEALEESTLLVEEGDLTNWQ